MDLYLASFTTSHFQLLSIQTLLVKNKASFNNLPPLPGMLSYREDNEKLYVSKGNKWDAIGSEKEVSFLC